MWGNDWHWLASAGITQVLYQDAAVEHIGDTGALNLSMPDLLGGVFLSVGTLLRVRTGCAITKHKLAKLLYRFGSRGGRGAGGRGFSGRDGWLAIPASKAVGACTRPPQADQERSGEATTTNCKMNKSGRGVRGMRSAVLVDTIGSCVHEANFKPARF